MEEDEVLSVDAFITAHSSRISSLRNVGNDLPVHTVSHAPKAVNFVDIAVRFKSLTSVKQ
jgi:hypothetical protein